MGRPFLDYQGFKNPIVQPPCRPHLPPARSPFPCYFLLFPSHSLLSVFGFRIATPKQVTLRADKLFSLVPAQYLTECLKMCTSNYGKRIAIKWCTLPSTSQKWQTKQSQRIRRVEYDRPRHPIEAVKSGALTCDALGVFRVSWRRTLEREEPVLLGIVVVLLEGGEPGSAVVLGTTATLLIAEVLAGVGREETWSIAVRHMDTEPGEKYFHLPTCSAFSQLRFILD